MNNSRLLELALKGLEAERYRIEAEIAEVRRLVTGDRQSVTGKKRQLRSGGRGKLTPEGRRRISEALKRRWAEYRKRARQ